MTVSYIIKWRSTMMDMEGKSAQPMSLFVAQAAAQEMNAMYPEIYHWVELYEEDKGENGNDGRDK